MTQSDPCQCRPPQRQCAVGDLLKRDRVGLAPGKRGGLLGQTRAAPGNVPAHDPHVSSLRVVPPCRGLNSDPTSAAKAGWLVTRFAYTYFRPRGGSPAWGA